MREQGPRGALRAPVRTNTYRVLRVRARVPPSPRAARRGRRVAPRTVYLSRAEVSRWTGDAPVNAIFVC